MTTRTQDKDHSSTGPLWRLSAWRRRLVDSVDRATLEDQLIRNGGVSHSYIFLIIASCAIATLGLMLNSGPIIMGAMLVAPLMGPIVLLGYAIAQTNVLLGIRSAKALVLGIVGALAISVAIVKLSPFMGPTSEMLSRTHPNLFDMLVAIFAGLVGGYALIHGRAGTIAGVTMTTALMPPLATSGYGLATANYAIFKGAFFLFLTNMLAIAFSIAGIAAWYGLATLRTPKELFGKTIVAGLILLLVSIPLMDALNRSVQRTVISNQVEAALDTYLEHAQARLGDLQIETGPGGIVDARAIVFTPHFDPSAAQRVEQRLKTRFNRRVDLKLDQVVLAKEKIPSADIPPPMAMPAPKPGVTSGDLLNQYLHRLVRVPFAVTDVDENTQIANLQVANSYDGTIDALWQLEQTLQAEFPDWQVHVIPPLMPLPTLYFPDGQTQPDAASTARLKILHWYLQRTQVHAVTLTGYSASNEPDKKGSQLAMQRATAVAGLFQDLHLATHLVAVSHSRVQRQEEQEYGRAAYRKVEISPLPGLPEPASGPRPDAAGAAPLSAASAKGKAGDGQQAAH